MRLLARLVLAPCLLAVPLLGAAPALADGPVAPTGVAVLTQTPAGPVVTTRTAVSAAAAAVLAHALDAQPGVVAAVDSPVRVQETVNDPLRAQQWPLDALSAEQVWAGGAGSGAVVAVVDTGVQADHPDLAGRLLPGYDTYDTSGSTSDGNGHGTHVAGIVAAVAGNGVGVAGFAPSAKVLPVRALGSDGSGYTSSVAKGVVWAADNGADVINLSLGGPDDSSVLDSAITYARSKGIVVVCAAGNEYQSGNPVEYPAATPGVLAVAAVDSGLQHAWFSNTGPYVALSAPGVNVLSTLPGSSYGTESGTSMASPYVAAAAALLISSGTARAAVPALLEASARDLGAPGRDDVYGYGLVDVAAARRLSAAAASTPPAPVAAVPGGASAAAPPATPSAATPVPATPPAAPAPVPAPPVVADPVPAAPGVTAPPTSPPASPPSAAPPVAPPTGPDGPSGPAAPPDPTPSAAVPPVLPGLSAQTTPVLAGRWVTVTAQAPAGTDLRLQRTDGTTWLPVRSGTTGAGGAISWSLVPDRTHTYRVVSAAGSSASLVLTVRQVVSAVALRGGAAGRVLPGGATVVLLQRMTGHGWRAAGQVTCSVSGVWVLLLGLPPGTLLRAVVQARPGLLAATSPVVRSR